MGRIIKAAVLFGVEQKADMWHMQLLISRLMKRIIWAEDKKRGLYNFSPC